jgi:hypothetical protein
MAIEQCKKKDGALVRYGAPTNKALKKIVIPVMDIVLRDCPDNERPIWKSSDAVYVFPNGSQIHLAGVNMHPDHLRGTACDLFLLDEAGSVTSLDYVVDDIAMPQFLDVDGGIVKGRKLILASSPAITPAHEFTSIANEAEANGNYNHFDIYQGGYSPELIEKFKEECGGEKTTTWMREYLALDVVDEERAIIPEWRSEYEQMPVIDDYYPFYFKYESLDIGVRDKTVCLFAHYDFKAAVLYIHDEFVVNGPQMTTEVLADGIKEKEPLVFGTHSVTKRVSDIDLLLIQDLNRLHGLTFQQTDKGRLEEMVNQVRIWVKQGKIIVDPKCTQLCGCLRYGVWNEKKTDFERSKGYGHYDALASLIYMVRNINSTTNPIPMYYGKDMKDHFITKLEKRGNVEAMKKAFGIKKGKY